MMLGKRPRPSMRRTTSLTEFTVDLTPPRPSSPPPPPSSDLNKTNKNPIKDRPKPVGGQESHLIRRNTVGGGNTDEGLEYSFLSAMVSPRNHRRNTSDFLETPHFLRSCGLCKRSLRPGRDIYMYRGDTAFCSLECRQQQMNHDERKEKCSMASKKETKSTTGSEASSKGETVAAA